MALRELWAPLPHTRGNGPQHRARFLDTRGPAPRTLSLGTWGDVG